MIREWCHESQGSRYVKFEAKDSSDYDKWGPDLLRTTEGLCEIYTDASWLMMGLWPDKTHCKLKIPLSKM